PTTELLHVHQQRSEESSRRLASERAAGFFADARNDKPRGPDPSARRRRWLILALIFGAIVLNYVDRQILSILKPTLKTEFGFDDRGYALLVNVFTVGYA